MKRLNLTLLISAMVFSGVLIYLTSCQKQHENQIQNNPIDEQSREVVQHILDFKAEMEYYRENPGLKSDYKKEIMQTILDWESNINMSFCYSYLELTDIVSFDTVIDVPLVSNDSIFMVDVSNKYYNEIIVIVQQHYFNTPFSDKKLMVVDLEPRSGGDSLWINSLVGNTLAPINVPKDWYWGLKAGVCLTHEFQFTLDAAVKIAQNTRIHFSQDPPEGTSWYFTNIENHTIEDPTLYPNPNDNIVGDNYKDYLVYYAHEDIGDGLTEDVMCLEHYGELAFYKQSYIDLTQGWIDVSGGKNFKECEYVGWERNNFYGHYLEQTFENTKLGFRYHTEIAVPTDDIATYE